MCIRDRERLVTYNTTYLPVSYAAVAKIEIAAGNKQLSWLYLNRALEIADSTETVSYTHLTLPTSDLV